MSGRQTRDAHLRLSELVGSRVRDRTGQPAGRIRDLAVRLDDAFPAVEAVLVGHGRHGAAVAVPVERFTDIGPGRTVLEPPIPAAEPDTSGLLLGRDVLDMQIVDTESRRLARVGEVDLAWEAGRLRVIAVDVGYRAILRRLGLRRLAHRTSRDAIDWAGVHLASGPGQPLQLASSAAAVHRLDPEDLAELLLRLPAARGAEVLDTIDAARAAAALAAVHPELGADLVEVLAPERALALLGEMPDEPAAQALREAGETRREALLGAMEDDRAQRLRAVIARPYESVPAPRPLNRFGHLRHGRRGARR